MEAPVVRVGVADRVVVVEVVRADVVEVDAVVAVVAVVAGETSSDI